MQPLSMAALLAGGVAGACGGVEAMAYQPRCDGGCGRVVASRGWLCPQCHVDQAKEANRVRFIGALDSLSPEGAFDWCRPTHPGYAPAVAKALEASRALADPTTRALAERIVGSATWVRKDGNVTILGPTGAGKTSAAIACALRVIDAGIAGTLKPDVVRFAVGMRKITAIEIARARAEHKLGGKPPAIIEAEKATLLILDELGFEETKHDPHAVRDVLYARYANGRKPTIVTSGLKLSELRAKYQAAFVRRLEEMGWIIDLHQ